MKQEDIDDIIMRVKVSPNGETVVLPRADWESILALARSAVADNPKDHI